MNQFLYIIFFLFCISNLKAQEHCMSNPSFRQTELFPGPSCELVYSDYLIIYADSIEFEGVKYKIKESTSFPFENKDDLLRSFSCYYSFLSASENILGELIKYELDEFIPRIGESFQFIYFNDCGREEQYIYVEDGLYFLRNDPLLVENEVHILSKSDQEEEIFEFVFDVDPNASVVYLEEPVFEYVTEQMLAKDGYTILEEVGVAYETNYHNIFNEYSSCPNAIIDTVYEQVLVKEGRKKFEITPAVLEVVTELVASQNEHIGESFYERIPQDSLTIPLQSPFYTVENFNISMGCNEFDFFDCINFEFVLNEGKDSVIYNVYEQCAPGFTSAGKYCYSNGGTVPAVYVKRDYEKLLADAFAVEKEVPAEYMTISLLRVTNKDELEESCIEVVHDSIGYQKLVGQASLSQTLIPTTYTTRVYKYFQQGGVIEVTEGNEEQLVQITTKKAETTGFVDSSSRIVQGVNPCYVSAVKKRLIEEGYLEVVDAEDINMFQLSVLTYQIDNDLPLGVIDAYFIDHLNVKFGF